MAKLSGASEHRRVVSRSCAQPAPPVRVGTGGADNTYFNTAADYRLGLVSALWERGFTPSLVNLRSSSSTWEQTPNGNPYISSSENVINPGLSGVEKASKTEQTLNDHGNVTERKQYGYYTPGDRLRWLGRLVIRIWGVRRILRGISGIGC